MKGLSGGLLTNPRACYAWMAEQKTAVPIWGVQSMEQLDDWIALAEEDPKLDDELRA
jgi:aryl-alcohol dehydrogenase-like predicted oxidoreductase